MGLLDNNFVRTTPKTGLEWSAFLPLVSNEHCDIWLWDRETTGKYLRLTYRDIYAWTDSQNLYLLKGKITDTPTQIAIGAENFPNLRQVNGNYPKIERVIACPCTFAYGYDGSVYGNISNIEANHIRVCVIFANGQIYHNYPSCNNGYDFYNSVYQTSALTDLVEELFVKFDESVVWDLPNRKHPVKTKTGDDATLIATGVYYYNPALPDRCYEFHPAIGASNGYGNTSGFGATTSINNISSGADIGVRPRFWRTNMDDTYCNPFTYMGGYVADNLFTMIGTYQSNNAAHPCRICVFGTQDGGRTWFCMYEFAQRDKVKVNNNYSDGTSAGVGLIQVASEGSGVYAIKRRTLIVPCAEDKEPTSLFEYAAEVNVQSINGTASGITITTASAHNLVNGDCIVVDFQSGQSANSRAFDWMVNPSADDNSGGNGVMFKVTNVTSTIFTATLYIGNPDNNLPVRHIHALNRCKDGVALSCGEEYPNGGWLLYDAIWRADAFANYNVALLSSTQNNWVRLNSTKDSFMRALGCIMRQEEDDTYCYIGVDHENTPMNNVSMPDGREQTFKHNSVGVWKVLLSGIDSQADNGILKYHTAQTCFGFQMFDGVMIFTGQYGNIALSYDNGETWSSAQIPVKNWGQQLCHFSGITYDRKFSIDNVLIQLK